MGQFGAVLMKSPSTINTCISAMANNITIPCSIKCRLGVDDFDSYQFLHDFVRIVSDLDGGSPVHHFVVHARKALLDGLNPAQNLTVPPLDYDKVFRLKRDFPSLSIHLNGGIKDIRQGYKMIVENGLQGLIVGRLAIENPYELAKIDHVDEAFI
jgi:tRNA-dihydrouridine synthase A